MNSKTPLNWTFESTAVGVPQGRAANSTTPDYPFAAGFLTDDHAGFREARRDRFSIWIVTLPGYSHSRCFEEVALSLQAAFLDLGYRVPVVADPAGASGTVITLGAHLMGRVEEKNWPEQPLLFNLEQVSPGSPWFRDDYLERLHRFPVWDYSLANIAALGELGVADVKHCAIGYHETLRRIRPGKPDIDVLFIGSLNDRRKAVLNELAGAGLKVRWGFDVYGEERDRLLSRARVVLNMHMYDARVFEVVRVSYLLANRLCVVSETGADTQQERRFGDAVAFAAREDLAETAVRLARDSQANRVQREAGFRAFSAMGQQALLAPLLGAD